MKFIKVSEDNAFPKYQQIINSVEKSIANQLNNIASTYIALGDNNNARIYMTKAKEALEKKTEQNAALPIDNKTPIHQINQTLNTEPSGDFDTNKAEIYLKKGTILSNQKKWKEAENNIQKSILEAKDRTKAGATAPACGLYLNKVVYS